MFSVNLAIVDDRLSCYIMQKHIVINSEIFTKEFDVDLSLPKLTVGSFLTCTKDLSIDILFPYQSPRDVNRKLMIIGLSLEDRILHFIIYKVLFC